MKTCKFCNAELPEGTTVCPSCGKDNAEEKTLSAGKTVLAIAAVFELPRGLFRCFASRRRH